MLSKVPFLGLTEIITVLDDEVLDKGCYPCLESGSLIGGQPYVIVPVGEVVIKSPAYIGVVVYDSRA